MIGYAALAATEREMRKVEMEWFGSEDFGCFRWNCNVRAFKIAAGRLRFAASGQD